MRFGVLLTQSPFGWAPHPHCRLSNLCKCHGNTLAWSHTSAETIQCSAAERPGVRHSQMALLPVIWWQIYTAAARPLLMLLLDGVGSKTIPAITSILQSVKNSMYWAPSQHSCPANTTGFTNKKDMVPFPKESTITNKCLPTPPRNKSKFYKAILNHYHEVKWSLFLPLISPVALWTSVKSLIWIGILPAICVASSAFPCSTSLGNAGTIADFLRCSTPHPHIALYTQVMLTKCMSD